MKKNTKAFTLIELLVVITIIGILVTLVVVNMGSAIDKTKITKVNKSLGSFWTAYTNNSSSFPQPDDLSDQSPAGFAAYAWDKWEWEQIEFWYMEDAADVADLKDDDADGMPAFLGDGDGDLDTDVTAAQKKAISWEIAIPKQGKTGHLANVAKRRKGGRFPVMWTKGLQSDGIWEGDSPWAGSGGHILWSDGKFEFYEDTSSDDDKGIFRDDSGNRTKDITQAIPEDWQILKPE